jgi:hypothetical protein
VNYSTGPQLTQAPQLAPSGHTVALSSGKSAAAPVCTFDNAVEADADVITNARSLPDQTNDAAICTPLTTTCRWSSSKSVVMYSDPLEAKRIFAVPSSHIEDAL